MSGLVFEKLTQILAAGQVWRLAIAADFFRIAAAPWALKVRIMKAGRILGEMDGWQAGDYLRGVEFDAVEVENGATAQAVTVQVAGGGVGSDRVIGEVSVIDGGEKTSDSGGAFMGGAVASAAAGTYSAVQLWNPVGSGKVLILRRASFGHSSDTQTYMQWYGTPLSDLFGKAQNKKVGGAVSSAELRRTSAAASIVGDGTLSRLFVKASENTEISMREPIIIEPGKGVHAICNIVNVMTGATFEFIERAQ